MSEILAWLEISKVLKMQVLDKGFYEFTVPVFFNIKEDLRFLTKEGVVNTMFTTSPTYFGPRK